MFCKTMVAMVIAMGMISSANGASAQAVAIDKVLKIEGERTGSHTVRFQVSRKVIRADGVWVFPFRVEAPRNSGGVSFHQWKTHLIEESDAQFKQIEGIFASGQIKTASVSGNLTGLYTTITVYKNSGNPTRFENVEFNWVKPLFDLADGIRSAQQRQSAEQIQIAIQRQNDESSLPDTNQFSFATVAKKIGGQTGTLNGGPSSPAFHCEYSVTREIDEAVPVTSNRNGIPHVTYVARKKKVRELRIADLNAQTVTFRRLGGGQLTAEMEQRLYSGKKCNVLLLAPNVSPPQNLAGHFRDDLIIAIRNTPGVTR